MYFNAQPEPPLIGTQIRFKKGFYQGGIVEGYEGRFAFIRLKNNETVKALISSIEEDVECKFITGGKSKKLHVKMWEEK